MTFDEELQAALDIEPSPAFVARVRMRIANEPAPRRWTAWWIVPAAGLAAAAVAAAVFVVRPPDVAHDASTPLLAIRTLPSISTQVVAPSVEPSTLGTPTAVAPRLPAPTVVETAEILLDPRETSALHRLIAGVSSGQIDLHSVSQSTPVFVAEPSPMNSIEIANIVIDPLPVGSEGARQ